MEKSSKDTIKSWKIVETLENKNQVLRTESMCGWQPVRGLPKDICFHL